MELSEPSPVLGRRQMCINGLNARLARLQERKNSLISVTNHGSLDSVLVPSLFGGQKRFSCILVNAYWAHGSGSQRSRYQILRAEQARSSDSQARCPPGQRRCCNLVNA